MTSERFYCCSDVNCDSRRMLEEIERLEDALQKIVQWSKAYPLDIFPEPDFAKVHAILTEHGMTLDAISAHNMRHVVEGVGKIARDALRSEMRQRAKVTLEAKR